MVVLCVVVTTPHDNWKRNHNGNTTGVCHCEDYVIKSDLVQVSCGVGSLGLIQSGSKGWVGGQVTPCFPAKLYLTYWSLLVWGTSTLGTTRPSGHIRVWCCKTRATPYRASFQPTTPASQPRTPRRKRRCLRNTSLWANTNHELPSGATPLKHRGVWPLNRLCVLCEQTCASGSAVQGQGPESGVQGPRSRVCGPGSKIQGLCSRVEDPGSVVQGPRSMVCGPGSKIQGLCSRVQDPGSVVQGPRSSVCGSGSKIQHVWSRVHCPGFELLGSGVRVCGLWSRSSCKVCPSGFTMQGFWFGSWVQGLDFESVVCLCVWDAWPVVWGLPWGVWSRVSRSPIFIWSSSLWLDLGLRVEGSEFHVLGSWVSGPGSGFKSPVVWVCSPCGPDSPVSGTCGLNCTVRTRSAPRDVLHAGHTSELVFASANGKRSLWGPICKDSHTVHGRCVILYNAWSIGVSWDTYVCVCVPSYWSCVNRKLYLVENCISCRTMTHWPSAFVFKRFEICIVEILCPPPPRETWTLPWGLERVSSVERHTLVTRSDSWS